jgi:hypothetical protein
MLPVINQHVTPIFVIAWPLEFAIPACDSSSAPEEPGARLSKIRFLVLIQAETGDQRTEPGEPDPGSQPTATRFTSARGAATLSGLAEPCPNIGAYRILRLLGQGMVTVYSAEQQNPQQIVAHKIIRLGVATPEHLRRFEQEAKLLRRLQHPGIVQIYETGSAHSGGGINPTSSWSSSRACPFCNTPTRATSARATAWN